MAAQANDPPDFEIDGNRLTPIVAGEARLAALVTLIESARSNVRLLYYIYCDDAAGQRVRAALEAAQVRGVAVSLILDGFGSDGTDPHFFDRLLEAGADVCRFIPRWGRSYLLRNHQKLAIADEERALVGGFNISNAYFDDGPEGWRDFGLQVEGPAAHHLVRYFDLIARWTHHRRARVRTLRRALRRWSQPEGDVRWLLGGPTRRLSPWARAVRCDLLVAKRCDIVAAYFAPNPGMLRKLERIARRGGAARVMTAARSDNLTTIAAARHCYRRLLKRGVAISEYQRSRLHTKLFVIDDAVHVGSANFDMRSLYLNLELMLRVEDAAFATHMRGYVEGEIDDARPITAALLDERAGWFDRLRWSIAYFIVAVFDPALTRRFSLGAGRGEL